MSGQEIKQNPKIGVFICHCGGNISDVVDVKKVAEEISKIDGVIIATDYIFMCSDPGQQLIKDHIKKGDINRVVIAACSPRLHELTFRRALESAGLNKFLLEQVNIREQSSWVHKPDPEGATQKAIKLTRGAVEKIKTAKPLDMIEIKSLKEALVVGGGIAGMRAALDLADRGSKVVLIEKKEELGGNANRPGKIYPSGKTAKDTVVELSAEVKNNPNITIMAGTEIESSEGGIGNFTSKTVNKNGEHSEIKSGVIVIATGFKPYEPYKGEYGYKTISSVITTPELFRLLEEKDNRLENVKNIGFIHCVGSRQLSGADTKNPEKRLNAHCSRVCCATTLFVSDEIRKANPGISIFNFYQDIRTYGRDQELNLYDKAAKDGTFFIKYGPRELPQVREEKGKVVVRAKDILSMNDEVEAELDLLVLAVGMQPADPGPAAGSFKLPLSADRFLQEVHPKLRPVETAVGGIFLAGTAQAPFDTSETAAAAGAAAVKAVSILEGEGVHLEPFVACVDKDKCKGHGECVKVCPAKGAIFMNDENKAEVNPVLCVSCGNCVAVCPERAIDINGYEIEGFEKMVDEIVKD